MNITLRELLVKLLPGNNQLYQAYGGGGVYMSVNEIEDKEKSCAKDEVVPLPLGRGEGRERGYFPASMRFWK